MAISEQARKNHDELFPPFIGYPRTLNALRVVDEVTATPKNKEA